MLDFLSRGILMDEAGGADGGGGGFSADIGSDVALVDDASMGDVDTGDAADGADETGLAVIDDAPAPDGGQVARYNPTEPNGRWSTRAQKDLATLRTTSPGLFQQVNRDRTTANRLRAMTPSGKQPFEYIAGLQKAIKDLRGEEGIVELRGKVDTFDELDEMFTNGDPQVLDKYLMGDPQGTNAIMKLLPHVVARVEKLEGGPAVLMGVLGTLKQLQNKVAPNAAVRAKAETIQTTLNDFFVEYHVSMLASLVDPTSEIGKKSVAALQEFLAKVQSACGLAPEALPDAPTPKPPQVNNEVEQQRQQLEKDRTEFRRNQWRTTSDSEKNRVTLKAWGEQSKGKKIDGIIREDVQVAIGRRLMETARSAGLDGKLESFFKANNMTGYTRELQNFYGENIPRIMKAELEKRVKRGPGTPAAQTGRPGQPPQRPQSTAGFVRVAAMPHSNEINHQTTTAMIMKKQAILNDGRKVFWA